jgi:hypothetical protein
MEHVRASISSGVSTTTSAGASAFTGATIFFASGAVLSSDGSAPFSPPPHALNITLPKTQFILKDMTHSLICCLQK